MFAAGIWAPRDTERDGNDADEGTVGFKKMAVGGPGERGKAVSTSGFDDDVQTSTEETHSPPLDESDDDVEENSHGVLLAERDVHRGGGEEENKDMDQPVKKYNSDDDIAMLVVESERARDVAGDSNLRGR